MSRISSVMWTAAMLTCAMFVTPALAMTDCDRRANDMKANFNNAWRGSYRDHGVLREAWYSAPYARVWPNCHMSYEEYFGSGGKSPKKKTPAKRKTTKEVRPSTSNLDEKANVDPDPDWANSTRDRILKGKQGEVVSVNEKRKLIAPYGSSDCAKISAKPNRGAIDWDWVIVRNSCSYPIRVLTCYYDVGRESNCIPRAGSLHWSLTGTIQPGGSIDSVATSKAWPWAVKKIVCDMRERSDLLCVLPK